jgi:hypothetical protein
MTQETVKSQLLGLFQTLDGRIEDINQARRQGGLLALPRAQVRILGQISLLVNERASAVLNLVQTADLDATLSMENAVKEELRSLLRSSGYVYDEDSPLIWIPEDAVFYRFAELNNIVVESIDPESTLVSKAIKAPEKNRQLIRQAIASNEFPTLVDRILKNGGKLEEFI